jgi:hypothetical protein
MNNISLNEIKRKTDNEVIQLLREFPFSSQWKNEKCLFYARCILALIQDNKYAKKTNINSFLKISF